MAGRRAAAAQLTTSVGAMTAALVVMAKAPVAGRCKTRLCPPLDPAQAATLAEAALADTLQTVAWTPADRHGMRPRPQGGPQEAPIEQAVRNRRHEEERHVHDHTPRACARPGVRRGPGPWQVRQVPAGHTSRRIAG